MVDTKRLLFAGYAPVHFLCFRPVYEILRNDPGLEVVLSGGFRRKGNKGEEPRYELEGFFEPFGVDEESVVPFGEVRDEHFDVVTCAHSSDVFFPASVGRKVQIFHGVSFKNFAVRDKVLEYDLACVPGSYHAERFEAQKILGRGACRFLLTGFPKIAPLVEEFDRSGFLTELGLDPSLPTVVYAPTGGKHNSLDDMGEEVLDALGGNGGLNVLVKPHDHPKKAVNWFEVLASRESPRLRLVRDYDIIPYLRASDLLLTDASSVAMEYTLLDRPIVFIDVPKLLENVTKRGGALDLETYGRKIGTVAATVEDVVPAIMASLANPEREGELRRKAASHLFHAPESATSNVVEVIRMAAGLRDDLPATVERLSPTRLSA